MIRTTPAQSPQYQRLPFSHNTVQAFLSSQQTRPCLKPIQLNTKQSLEKMKTNQNHQGHQSHQSNQLSFLKKKPSTEDPPVKRTPEGQITPNARIRTQQLFVKASSPNSRINEYSSLQGTSSKRFNHSSTGSMNVSALQQQLSILNRKADAALIHTPTKYISIEHSKSRSVIDSKENEFSNSNLLSQAYKSTISTISSPIINDSIQSYNSTRVKCCLHPEKKAKYYGEQTTRQYYCTKCALQFAQKQINLKELPSEKQINGELQSFMSELETSQREKFPQVCRNQLASVKLYYQAQIQQCDTVYRQLSTALQASYEKAHQTLSNQMNVNVNNISILTREVTELNEYLDRYGHDIQSNWSSQAKTADMDAFRHSLSKYRERLAELKQLIVQMNAQQIMMISMAPKDIGSLANAVAEGFSLVTSTTPLIPQDFKENVRTQPTPEKQHPQIESFTPKTRMRTDVQESQQPVNNSNNSTSNNFFQYFFNKAEPIVESVESCRTQTVNSLHSNAIYVSFENRDFFQQAAAQAVDKPKQEEIMVLQSYRNSRVVSEEDEKQCHSTPHSPASGATKSQYERMSTTQQVKVLPDQQRSKQTFRTLFDTQPEEDIKQSPTPSENDKFKTILHKVNANQSKTHQFYQNLYPKSPRYESEDEDREVQTVFQSRELGSSKQELSVPSDSSHSSEKKVNVRYQKTLFCSPTFKNDDLNVSQSD